MTREEAIAAVVQAWNDPEGQRDTDDRAIDTKRLNGMRDQLGRVWPALADAVAALVDSTG